MQFILKEKLEIISVTKTVENIDILELEREEFRVEVMLRLYQANLKMES